MSPYAEYGWRTILEILSRLSVQHAVGPLPGILGSYSRHRVVGWLSRSRDIRCRQPRHARQPIKGWPKVAIQQINVTLLLASPFGGITSPDPSSKTKEPLP